MPVEFSRLLAEDATGISQALAIYREAIEPTEQKSTSELTAALADPRYLFLVGRQDGRVECLAVMFFPLAADFWLLEYVAVDGRQRSKGLGEALFKSAKDAAAARAPDLPCVLEVDLAGGPSRPGNDVNGRLRFYSRMRCRVIQGLDYILPLDHAGTPPPMMLLVHGLENVGSLPKQSVRLWLEALYTQVYARRSNDSRIELMVSTLPETVPLVSV